MLIRHIKANESDTYLTLIGTLVIEQGQEWDFLTIRHTVFWGRKRDRTFRYTLSKSLRKGCTWSSRSRGSIDCLTKGRRTSTWVTVVLFLQNTRASISVGRRFPYCVFSIRSLIGGSFASIALEQNRRVHSMRIELPLRAIAPQRPFALFRNRLDLYSAILANPLAKE